jgi:hypothetical protein
MKSELVLHTKEVKEDEIVEIKIRKVSKTANMPDGLRISLVYVKHGKRILGYDNAEGKGYHRHVSGKEEQYMFSTVWTLLEDFKKDIKVIRGRDWDES